VTTVDHALTVKYAILGSIEVVAGERRAAIGGRRQAALLALLLVNANRALSSERISDALWGGEPGAGPAGKRLHMAIVRLRRALDGDGVRGESVLQTVGNGYLLAVGPGELDAQVFEAQMRAGCSALETDAPERAAELLRDALGLWRGPALADVAYEEFAQAEIRRLEELRLSALEARVDADLRLGRHPQLIGELEAAIAAHPTRERLSGQLMLAYYRCGRQAHALELYRRTQQRLDTEFGLQPGPALAALQRQILGHDGTLQLAAPRPPPRAPRPVARAGPGTTGMPSVDGPLVGRESEHARLAQIVQEAQAGRRRLVCFAGEPGVGKTRLAAQAAGDAHAAGFTVGWGASIEGLRPPYGVWIGALTALVEQAPDDVLREHVARHGGELARLVRPLGRRITGIPPPQPSDPETERYLLFSAVAGLLTALSDGGPVALGLDDLQWADAESLALLQYVAAATAAELPLLILLTYRDCDLYPRHPLRGVLAELERGPGVERLALDGLDVDAVAELVALRTGRATDRDSFRLAGEITDESGGNPFFAGEILRHLQESGALSAGGAGAAARGSLADAGLPRNVREVIGWRVERLGPEAQSVLAVAAVIGQTFDLGLLERVVDVDDPLAVLDAATRSALVAPADAPGRYAFVHALINHALYDSLSVARRARLHCSVANALEASPGAEPGQLAHHWALCGIADHMPAAVHYARLAGERALGQLAPDVALHWFTEALALLRRHDADDRERCDVLIGMGEAKRRIGDPTFRNNLLAASRIAARLDDHERLTRAVLANTLGPFGAAGGRDRLRIETLERALRALADDWPYRPRMMAILGKELYFGQEPGRGSQLAVAALAQARRRADRHELTRVMALAASISPIASLETHAELVYELGALAEQVGDPELRFQAANAAYIYGMHGGDRISLDAGLNTMLALAADIGQPILRWTSLWAHSAYRTLAGDLAGGETLTLQAAAAARAQKRPHGELITFGQLLSIRTEQDRLDEMRELLALVTARSRRLPVLGLAAGFIDAETGRLESARAVLAAAAADGFQFPFDRTLAFSLARCADIALRVGAAELAGELYDRLLPYRDQFATPAGISSRGSIELSLGRLASLLRRPDAADAHLLAAERAHTRLRAPLLDARTALARGTSLLARGAGAGAAAQPLDRALRLARRHGSAAIAREARALLAAHGSLTAC
jgi:DNA-binding SARP family transcriptional activator